MTATLRNRIRAGILNCPNCGAAAGPESVTCSYCHSSLATLVCASCFGSVRAGMRHCPSCGVPVDEQSPVAVGAWLCPRCRESLVSVTIGCHELAECLCCGGLWVDRATMNEIGRSNEEQEAVMRFTPRASVVPDRRSHTRAYVPCPVCSKLMNRTNYAGCSGVVIDWCRDHGSWFDYSELHRIVIFIRDGGLRRSRERQKEQIKLESERLRLRESDMARLARLGASPDRELECGTGSLFGALRKIWGGLR